ncbi:MAG: hypothetical protein K2Z81_27825 [Cyanobacteria bacterium]|nr:hypothetical protein [Cyanobacteriota bacterium]
MIKRTIRHLLSNSSNSLKTGSNSYIHDSSTNKAPSINSSLKALSIVFAVSLLSCMGTAKAGAQEASTTWFVMNSAPGTVRDGRSWQTAWREFNQIDWNQIKPGDRIEIHAGAAPPPGYVTTVPYQTPLVIPKSGLPGKPITIAVSNEAGHNGGIASLQKGWSSTATTGIDVGNNSYITVIGTRWKSLSVSGYNTGVYVGPNSTNVIFKNFESRNNGFGLKLEGPASCDQLLVSDNASNVSCLVQQSCTALPSFNRCWIYDNSIYPTDGITTYGTGARNLELRVSDCVLGPRLDTNIKIGGRNTVARVSNTLLINPCTTNVSRLDDPSCAFIMDRVTSFLTTPYNLFYRGHSCLTFTSNADQVSNSVFYGGAVQVNGSNMLGSNNFQFATTGNTMVLSPSQVDPKFVSNVSYIQNYATTDQLKNLNFALQSGSPATGSGSSLTSVAQLLSTNQ